MKAAVREEKRVATLARRMWEASVGIKRGGRKRRPRRDVPGRGVARHVSDTSENEGSDDGEGGESGHGGGGDSDAESEGHGGAGVGHGGGGIGEAGVGHGGGGIGEAGVGHGGGGIHDSHGGGGIDGGGGHGGGGGVHLGGGMMAPVLSSDTGEEHDDGMAVADPDAVPVAPPAVHVAEPPPQVVGERVLRRPDGKHIGNIWRYWDDGGNESIITHCRYHAPPCKKRTTVRKHPDWDGALRWIQAGRHTDRGRHLDMYEDMVLPPEFRSKKK